MEHITRTHKHLHISPYGIEPKGSSPQAAGSIANQFLLKNKTFLKKIHISLNILLLHLCSKAMMCFFNEILIVHGLETCVTYGNKTVAHREIFRRLKLNFHNSCIKMFSIK
jgi:hypothetical protein